MSSTARRGGSGKRCGAKFTDERWELTQQSWSGERDKLCGPCAQDDADRAEAERVARRQAEEAAARAAVEARTKKSRGLFGRRQSGPA